MKQFLHVLAEPEFRLPLFVFALAAGGIASRWTPLYIAAIAVGLFALVLDCVKKIRQGKYSLDYIAVLAMAVALGTHEFLAGAVIAIMILVSEALDTFGARSAEAALRRLVEKIPKACDVKTADDSYAKKDIHDVRDGDVIFIRDGEIVPLDGWLVSPHALMDEANLTGEIEPQPYAVGQLVKSGLVNLEAGIELRVSGDFSRSTYQKIVELVGVAKHHPAKLVRLAEHYNYWLTVITLAIAGGAYFFSHNPITFLAVLVMATPCPLLIAAPVSFLGGLNKASKKNIIIKKPAALETLSQVTHIYFDKTGTLTLGEPALVDIRRLTGAYSKNDLLAIAASLEIHSLHPLAKTIIHAAQKENITITPASNAEEHIGEGIMGTVDGASYRLAKSKTKTDDGIVIDLFKGDDVIGRFAFEDQIKPGTIELLAELKKSYTVAILTGDTEENAKRLFGPLGIDIHAKLMPEDKYALIKATRLRGGKVMMIGDGLNDAPALALADVGVVFSGSENSASIDAAAIAILGRDIHRVADVIAIAQNATRIARQSIQWGIGLSIVGMLIAALGFIPPVTGAILQEAIDATVILNALRAAK